MRRSWDMTSHGLLALTFLSAFLCSQAYDPPKPTVLPLFPKGLRVSIPDEPGISLIAFHGKINEEFDSLEGGTLSRDVIKARNGRWTYQDRSVRLKIGDVIYFWIHVVYEGLGYNLLDQNHTVTVFYNDEGEPVDTTKKPCERSSTLFKGSQPCKGELIFEEKFDSLDTNRWTLVERFAGPSDNEFVVYQGNERNVKVKDGELRLTPTLLENEYNQRFIRVGNLVLKRCTGQLGTPECQKQGASFHILPPVSSGRVDTKKSFSFLYGRVEVRAKLPRGDWIYPLITLEPLNNGYGPGYKSGQLRVASAVGNAILNSPNGEKLDGSTLVAGAVISRTGSIRDRTLSKRRSTSRWADSYHVYELEWTPNRIIVRVDGAEYGNQEYSAANYKNEVLGADANQWASNNAPFDREFYLSLGVAVGGQGEFPDDCVSNDYTKPWRNAGGKALLQFFNATGLWSKTWVDEATTLKVDYVKVFALS